MPWSKGNVDDHIKGLDDRAKGVWVRVANDALKSCEAKGEPDCEGAAIKQASAVAGRIGESLRVAETYLTDAFVARNISPLVRVSEVGRKLSGQNEGRVRAAMEQLGKMLAELEKAYDEEEQAEDDEEKGEGEQEALADAAALRAALQVLAEVAMSHDERRMALHRALNLAAVAESTAGVEPPYRTPIRVDEAQVLFHEDGPYGGQLFTCKYAISEQGGVKLGRVIAAREADTKDAPDSAGCAECTGDCPCHKGATAASEADDSSDGENTDFEDSCSCDEDGEDCTQCEEDCEQCTQDECDNCVGDCQCAEVAEESGVYAVWPNGRFGKALVLSEADDGDETHGDIKAQHDHMHAHDGDTHSHMHAHDGDANHADHEHNDEERDALSSEESLRHRHVWSWGTVRGAPFGWVEIAERDMDPKVGGGTDRDKLKPADFAWPDSRDYPIVTKGDVADAVDSIGRLKGGDASDEERAQLKGNIKRIAKRKGFADALPDEWKSEDDAASAEALRIPAPYTADDLVALREDGAEDIEGAAIKLAETAVRKDGTAQVKIIAPGWGSSGYYSESMLQRDGPKVFRRGTPMFVNHPTMDEESARPERDLTQLAGVLTKDAVYRANGPTGPGLYGEARIYPHWKDFIEAVAPDTGVSIRALGKGSDGEVDGRKGKVIESLVAGKSVDFVTAPGAGGHVLQLFESARGGVPPTVAAQGGRSSMAHNSEITAAQAREIMEANLANQGRIRDLENQLARERERGMFREAKEIVMAELEKAANLPPATRVRVAERVIPMAKPGIDGGLDNDDLMERLHLEVKAEVAYLSSIHGLGSIRGMGSSFGESNNGAHMGFGDEIDSRHRDALEESFRGLGMSEEAARVAARGRD